MTPERRQEILALIEPSGLPTAQTNALLIATRNVVRELLDASCTPLTAEEYEALAACIEAADTHWDNHRIDDDENEDGDPEGTFSDPAVTLAYDVLERLPRVRTEEP